MITTLINKQGRVVYSAGLDQFCVEDKLKVITLIKVHHPTHVPNQARVNITETLYHNRTTLETIFKFSRPER